MADPRPLSCEPTRRPRRSRPRARPAMNKPRTKAELERALKQSETARQRAVATAERERAARQQAEVERDATAAHLEAQQRVVAEAVEQQTATSEILRVISASPMDVQPIFDAIVESAVRLCDAIYS